MVARQTAELREEEAEAPEVYGGVVGGVDAGSANGVVAAKGIGGGMGGGVYRAHAAPAAPMAAAELKLEGRDALAMLRTVPGASTVAAPAEGAERGELFEYSFETPVTVRNGESAMLPFLQQKVAARKLLIFSTASSEYPRNAAEIANNTGKTLDGGPITVFDGNAYAGEALMETLKAGDKRLVSYAIDLGTRVATNIDSRSDLVREIHVRRGVLTVRSAVRETKTYTIHNVDAKPKTLIVEHAIRPEFRLIQTKPAETTASRLPLRSEAGASGYREAAGERGAGGGSDHRARQQHARLPAHLHSEQGPG